MELFTYFRSSAAYRLRIALNLKGLDAQMTAVNLLKGEHRSPEYLAINSQGLVPSFKTDDGEVLTQSPAILEWLEENHPQTPLLPVDSVERAKVRSWCYQIGCDIHPICNLRVLKYVAGDLGGGDEGKKAWLHHWMGLGFDALEAQLGEGPYCNGDQVTLADVYLIPQVFNALRFEVDMTPYPKIMAAYEACNQLDAFQKAAPANQVDAQ
ncbi:maleylacetoacetate isomerase [Pseudomaricurvus alkylphenolicus]|jgi:maleylacetoacetate isomerase|uniref:maleylacetoacetate isomerase n=1 Tax=Pseudomaricurvus alkylphenolicus TaxID=1306991 RepID=UPI00141FA222|nr:maleylacetoacetate isomerase [Pseudomaricurvus alkylphenolicus]NIB41040.1 maleylacetoacetate isomerase [Pseudomaricurvus alkylphenolicus]